MADEMPTARGFSSGSQGSWEGAPRRRGADALVPWCWPLRNTSEWQGPFLSLKSVCAEDRRAGRTARHSPWYHPGVSGVLEASDGASCPPRHLRGLAGRLTAGGRQFWWLL